MKSREIRAAFLKHVATMLELAGEMRDDVELHAKTVMTFETALAESVLKNAELRDPDKTYHLMDLAGLNLLTPNFDWKQFLREVGLPESTPHQRG